MSGETNFLDRVSFDRVYAGLASRGITFDEEDKRLYEEIVRKRITENGGTKLLGSSLGEGLNKLVFMLIYFIQNAGQNLGSFDMDQFTQWMKDRGESTEQMTDFRSLFTTMGDVNAGLMLSGRPNLIAAADITTGVHHGPLQTALTDVDWSLWRQIRGGTVRADGTVDTSTHLIAVAEGTSPTLDGSRVPPPLPLSNRNTGRSV